MSLGDLKFGGRARYFDAATKAAFEQFFRWVVGRMRPIDRPDFNRATKFKVLFGAKTVSPKSADRWFGGVVVTRFDRNKRLHVGGAPTQLSLHIDYRTACRPPADLASIIVHETRHLKDMDELVADFAYNEPTDLEARRVWRASHKPLINKIKAPAMERRAIEAQRRFLVDVPDSEVLAAFNQFFPRELADRLCPQASYMALMTSMRGAAPTTYRAKLTMPKKPRKPRAPKNPMDMFMLALRRDDDEGSYGV